MLELSIFGLCINDMYIIIKVKSVLVGIEGVFWNFIKVIIEVQIVFLMGVVIEVEGNKVIEVVCIVSGVNKVVKVFDYVSEDECKCLDVNVMLINLLIVFDVL